MPPGVIWLFSGSCSYINGLPRWISFKLSVRVLKGSQLGLSLRWKKIEAWYHFTHGTPSVWPCVSVHRAFVFPDCLSPKTHGSGGALWPHNSPVVITATNGPPSVMERHQWLVKHAQIDSSLMRQASQWSWCLLQMYEAKWMYFATFRMSRGSRMIQMSIYRLWWGVFIFFFCANVYICICSPTCAPHTLLFIGGLFITVDRMGVHAERMHQSVNRDGWWRWWRGG